MRQGAKIKLIDLDASASFREDNHQFSGAKFSSAYIPPEMVYMTPSRGGTASGPCAKVKQVFFTKEGEVDEERMVGYDPILAHPAHDMWALGVVMFQICSGETLFHANDEDNIDDDSLLMLGEWLDEFKNKKLSKVADKDARNLVAQLLSKDYRYAYVFDCVLSDSV